MNTYKESLYNCIFNDISKLCDNIINDFELELLQKAKDLLTSAKGVSRDELTLAHLDRAIEMIGEEAHESITSYHFDLMRLARMEAADLALERIMNLPIEDDDTLYPQNPPEK